MVPAMRVFNPSVGKRLMVLIPDSPAVSLFQLSDLPAPSDVTTPRPVTTTSGRPILSLPAAILLSSADQFDQCEAFASPVPDAGHQNLGQIPVHWPLQTRRVTGRKQTTMTKRDGGQRDVHWKLRLQPMPDICSRGAHGKIRVPLKKLALLRGRRIGACRTREYRRLAKIDLVLESIP